MFRFMMDSFMNTGSSLWQCGQVMRSASEGGIVSSRSQTRHLKWIIAPIRPLVVVLLIAAGVQAQSVADAARQERERQAKTHSTRVIKSTGPVKVEEPKPSTAAVEQPKTGDAKEAAVPEPSKEAQKSPAATTPDPAQAWNKKLDQLRASIRALQDQEMALLLQKNQVTNQVYAPVTDPATQERSLAQLGQIQEQIAGVRKDLAEAKKQLDALQLQGPPKK